MLSQRWRRLAVVHCSRRTSSPVLATFRRCFPVRAGTTLLGPLALRKARFPLQFTLDPLFSPTDTANHALNAEWLCDRALTAFENLTPHNPPG